MYDSRIAYGVACVWWDSVHNAGSTGTHPLHAASKNMTVRRKDGSVNEVCYDLPCCPGCGSMLFEVQDEEAWFASVDKFEKDGHPGYRAFVEWGRGKCYPTTAHAVKAYQTETGNTVVVD